MNKFLSKFVAIALLSGVSMTAANAANEAVWSGTTAGGTGANGVVQGGELVGGDVNVTVTLNADMNPGTTFDFHVIDGSVANSGSFFLCNGDVVVGKYVNLVSTNAAGRATVIGMEFSTDANTSLTQSGEVLNLVDGSNIGGDCNTTVNTLSIVPDLGKCVRVKSDNGLNNNGSRVVTEINSADSAYVLEYRADVMVSCNIPTCTIHNDGLQFTTASTVSGVNKRTASTLTADRNASANGDYSACYSTVGCTPIATYAPCTTIISIQNNMLDSNITGFTLNTLFGGASLPSDMVVTYISPTGNDKNITVGTGLVINDVNISSGEEENITISFNPNGGGTIVEGLMSANLSALVDANRTTQVSGAVIETKGIANFGGGISTDFTVTYMNPSFKSFAMISAKADTKLTATITDSAGVTAEATFPDLSAGKTTFVWADHAGHATSPLETAATAAGLNNAWTVEFHVTAAVDVAAYMEANGGQRTLTVLYPDYTATGL